MAQTVAFPSSMTRPVAATCNNWFYKHESVTVHINDCILDPCTFITAIQITTINPKQTLNSNRKANLSLYVFLFAGAVSQEPHLKLVMMNLRDPFGSSCHLIPIQFVHLQSQPVNMKSILVT